VGNLGPPTGQDRVLIVTHLTPFIVAIHSANTPSYCLEVEFGAVVGRRAFALSPVTNDICHANRLGAVAGIPVILVGIPIGYEVCIP
jgi:hypothetical protein